MTSHDIFIDSHFVDDGSHRNIGIAVLCSCSQVLLEREGPEPQVCLDEINEVRWEHYDSDVPHDTPACEVCGETDD
jgi:hypothetical protein